MCTISHENLPYLLHTTCIRPYYGCIDTAGNKTFMHVSASRLVRVEAVRWCGGCRALQRGRSRPTRCSRLPCGGIFRSDVATAPFSVVKIVKKWSGPTPAPPIRNEAQTRGVGVYAT